MGRGIKKTIFGPGVPPPPPKSHRLSADVEKYERPKQTTHDKQRDA